MILTMISKSIRREATANTSRFATDRKEAIAYFYENAKLRYDRALGKGHEDYQEIKGVKYHFDEREAVAEILMR